MTCPACHCDLPLDSRFCNACGAPVEPPCPSCGRPNPADSRFCRACGTRLGQADTPSEPASEAHLRDGERRHLTVLFCDVVGSTELSTRMDPEDFRALLGRYYEAAAAVVERFGGQVAQYQGDGVVAHFGWPTAHGDDTERGVRAALGIVEAVRGLDLPVRLAVRVGLHTGLVVVSDLGPGGRPGPLALGETPNVAARVQALAEPDSVLVTAATHRLVSGMFVVEDRGQHALKGRGTPVTLYWVRQPSGVRSRFAAAAAAGLTPLIGREDERRLLRGRWERAQEGDGQVALVTGEAGIGKSRLVQAFKEDLAGTPHTWIEFFCSPFFQHSPFQPIVEALEQAFAWDVDDPPDRRCERLERALDLAGLRTAEAIPLVAPLLSLAVPDTYPPLLLAPEQQRRRLLATLAAWLFGVARVQPVVLVVEDLQWVDPSTLELLGLLAEQGATVPLLLVGTARPEFRAPWPLRAHHAQLTLARLSRRHVREMVRAVIARAALPEAVVEAVVARTDGVPLFVEELTRLVLKRAGLGADVAPEIPSTLHDSLMARLDRLGPAKEMAQLGAVIGREFSYTLVQAVAALPEAELESALAALVDAELVYARGLPPEATYLFKHALVQEAAYASLLKSRRRELHRRERARAGGAVPGDRGAPARAARAPPDGGGRGRTSSGRVAARRRARAGPLRVRGGGRTPHQGPRDPRHAARDGRAGGGGAAPARAPLAGARGRQGLHLSGGRGPERPRAAPGRAVRRLARDLRRTPRSVGVLNGTR